MPRVNQLLNWVMGINFLCGIVFLLTIVYEYGFRISAAEYNLIHTVYHTVWVIFLVTTTIQIVFRQEDSSFKFTPWTWILTILLYLTLLPVVFKKPEETTGVYWVWVFFHHAYYKGTILVLLSFSQLSGILVRLLGKRTNPSLILAGSFLVFILLGTGLLMLPRATYHGISFMDALFTATSATCVTGLVTVDVPSTFTLEGQILIILLIQIGGLGVMTLTSFFAMFFMGNTSLYNQLMVGDMISSNSLNSLLSTLLYILGFTLAIEGVGMVVIWLSVHGTLGMTLQEELFFSAFHSVSAFCNAGFSTLPGGMGNPAVMQGHNLLYITLGLLIALGGIGFPILVNLYETVAYYLQAGKFWLLRRSGRFRKKVHLYNLNTKIVLVATVFLLIGGTLAIAALEWNHSFAGMPVADKWVHASANCRFCQCGADLLVYSNLVAHGSTDDDRRRHAIYVGRREGQCVCGGINQFMGCSARDRPGGDSAQRTFARFYPPFERGIDIVSATGFSGHIPAEYAGAGGRAAGRYVRMRVGAEYGRFEP